MNGKGLLFDSSTGESGSIILQVLIVGLILSSAAGAIISFISYQNSVWAGRRIAEEINNLNATLTMSFSSRETCQKNLVAGFFGNSVSSVSANKQVQIQLPAPSSAILKAGSEYHQLHINQIYFSGPAKPVWETKPDGSYLVDMTIQVKDGSGTRQTTIPFYLIDTGGNLTCFTTNYPQPQPVSVPPLNRKVTMEDVICRQWQKRIQKDSPPPPGTPDFIYTPVSKTCVYGP